MVMGTLCQSGLKAKQRTFLSLMKKKRKNETDQHDVETGVEDYHVVNDDNVEIDEVESDSQPWSSNSEGDCDSD